MIELNYTDGKAEYTIDGAPLITVYLLSRVKAEELELIFNLVYLSGGKDELKDLLNGMTMPQS